MVTDTTGSAGGNRKGGTWHRAFRAGPVLSACVTTTRATHGSYRFAD